MKSLFVVFLGGGLGSAGRYLLALAFNKNYSLPYGTFLANIIGSLLIGILFGLFLKNQNLENDYKLFAVIGFCGGFTTMSSFSAESLALLRSGNFLQFALYLSLTIVVCLGFTYLGFQVTK